MERSLRSRSVEKVNAHELSRRRLRIIAEGHCSFQRRIQSPYVIGGFGHVKKVRTNLRLHAMHVYMRRSRTSSWLFAINRGSVCRNRWNSSRLPLKPILSRSVQPSLLPGSPRIPRQSGGTLPVKRSALCKLAPGSGNTRLPLRILPQSNVQQERGWSIRRKYSRPALQTPG